MLKILRTYLLKLQVQMARSTQWQLSLKPKAKLEIYTISISCYFQKQHILPIIYNCSQQIILIHKWYFQFYKMAYKTLCLVPQKYLQNGPMSHVKLLPLNPRGANMETRRYGKLCYCCHTFHFDMCCNPQNTLFCFALTSELSFKEN